MRVIDDRHTIKLVFGTVIPLYGRPFEIAGFYCNTCENQFFLRIEQENRPSHCPYCGIHIDNIDEVFIEKDGSMTRADEDLS